MSKLYAVVGAIPEADDVTLHLVGANTRKEAEATFKAKLEGDLSETENDSNRRIYGTTVFISQCLELGFVNHLSVTLSIKVGQQIVRAESPETSAKKAWPQDVEPN